VKPLEPELTKSLMGHIIGSRTAAPFPYTVKNFSLHLSERQRGGKNHAVTVNTPGSIACVDPRR
jgi:hypothetical protein